MTWEEADLVSESKHINGMLAELASRAVSVWRLQAIKKVLEAEEPPEPCPAPLNKTLNDYARECHEANQKWWHDLRTGEPLHRNFGELIALVHSELSEALEGHRKDLMDDKLPHRKMVEVELADTLIRIFDIAVGFGLDLEGAYQEKMAYNAHRADHKRENRLLPGGKAY